MGFLYNMRGSRLGTTGSGRTCVWVMGRSKMCGVSVSSDGSWDPGSSGDWLTTIEDGERDGVSVGEHWGWCGMGESGGLA